MINAKKINDKEESNRKRTNNSSVADASQLCCSPEFTEGCIESDPYDAP